MRRERLELVGRRDERQSGELGDLGRKGVGETRVGVEPGADRGAALGQRVDAGVTGVASWVWVRPILTMSANSFAFASSAAWRWRSAGFSRSAISRPVAMCIADGNVSFDDWLRLTSSLG